MTQAQKHSLYVVWDGVATIMPCVPGSYVARGAKTLTKSEISAELAKQGIRLGTTTTEHIKKVNVVKKPVKLKKATNKYSSNVLKNDIFRKALAKKLKKGIKFSKKAEEHMKETSRFVPIQTLKEAILYGDAYADPRYSGATMYYTTMHKNGKKYNLEVLYDFTTNTILHFKYTHSAIGNLPKILKK